jgi:hypothetical protein
MSTTSINDLPTDPVGGGSIGGNVSLIASELPSNMEQPSVSPSLSLDQSTISQIVNGLQQASINGLTALPSRDIPQSTQGLTNDIQVIPNYVPAPVNKDYINESESEINTYRLQNDENVKHSLDSLYDEMQTPLLLAILYFMFQLPIVKKSLYKHLSFLCNSDGNYNIKGLLFMSSLFGFIYFSLSKVMIQFNKF